MVTAKVATIAVSTEFAIIVVSHVVCDVGIAGTSGKSVVPAFR